MKHATFRKKLEIGALIFFLVQGVTAGLLVGVRLCGGQGDGDARVVSHPTAATTRQLAHGLDPVDVYANHTGTKKEQHS